MKRFRAWLGVVLIFLCGAVCGGLVTTRVLQQKLQALLTGGSGKTEDPIVAKLRRDLKLDAGQQTQVRQIVSAARGQLDVIKAQAQPQTRGIILDGEAKVRALLRPEQVTKFDEMLRTDKGRHLARP